MNRIFVRTFGYCISIFGTFIGRNANAIIDNSVYMQCEYSVSDYGNEVFETTGGIFTWAACDDNSKYILANGDILKRDYFPECFEQDYKLHIMTTGINGDNSICYCNSTGIACPDGPGWREWLNNIGCTQDQPGTGIDDCIYHENLRGLYLTLKECKTGYVQPAGTGALPTHYKVTGGYSDQNPAGYCYQCPGLGYSGDAFYEYTPAPGQISSGQFYWGPGNGSGGCKAGVIGSISNSNGSFTIEQECIDY